MDTTPGAVERSIRRLGGKPLTVGVVDTWAFVDTVDSSVAFGGGGLTSTDKTSGVVPGSRLLRIASGLLTLLPGMEFVLDGVPGVVMACRPDFDPSFLAVLVAAWTHTVTIYRPTTVLQGERGRRRESFAAVAEDVPAFLVESAGDVQPGADGQVVRAAALLMVPPGTPAQPLDGVFVTAGGGHARWRVQGAAVSGGPDWNVEIPLVWSEEVFS